MEKYLHKTDQYVKKTEDDDKLNRAYLAKNLTKVVEGAKDLPFACNVTER